MSEYRAGEIVDAGDLAAVRGQRDWAVDRIAELENERDKAQSVIDAVCNVLVGSAYFNGHVPIDVVVGVERLVAAHRLLANDYQQAIEGRDKAIRRADEHSAEEARMTVELAALRPRTMRSESADLEQMRGANTLLSDRLAEAHTAIDHWRGAHERVRLEADVAERECDRLRRKLAGLPPVVGAS